MKNFYKGELSLLLKPRLNICKACSLLVSSDEDQVLAVQVQLQQLQAVEDKSASLDILGTRLLAAFLCSNVQLLQHCKVVGEGRKAM